MAANEKPESDKARDDEITLKKIVEEYKSRVTPEDLKWYEQEHELAPLSDVIRDMEAYASELEKRSVRNEPAQRSPKYDVTISKKVLGEFRSSSKTRGNPTNSSKRPRRLTSGLGQRRECLASLLFAEAHAVGDTDGRRDAPLR